MKQIQFNNKKYECPTSWDEVTLEQQIKVSKDSALFTHDATKKVAILSGYMGIEAEELRKADVRKVAPMFTHLQFLSEPIPDKLVGEFKFKGDTYHVSQNLIEQEFQDFVSLENIMNDTEGNIMEALPYIVAILAKKVKEDGSFESMDDYDVEKRAEEFRKLPISIANGISVFFCTNESLSTVTTLLSSNPNQIVQAKVNEVLTTLKPQAGMGLPMRLLTGIMRRYLRYIKRLSEKHFTSTPRRFSIRNWRVTFKKWLSRTLRGKKKGC